MVKAFNILGAADMVSPGFPQGPPTMLVCGDHEPAVAVREIAADSGAVLVNHETHWLARFADEDPNAAGHLEMADHALRTMGLGELTSL